MLIFWFAMKFRLIIFYILQLTCYQHIFYDKITLFLNDFTNKPKKTKK